MLTRIACNYIQGIWSAVGQRGQPRSDTVAAEPDQERGDITADKQKSGRQAAVSTASAENAWDAPTPMITATASTT